MDSKIKIFVLIFLSLFGAGIAYAQIASQGTTGLVAPQLAGNGPPSNQYVCSQSMPNVTYIQLDAANGRLWICDQVGGSWAWDQQLNAVKGVATTGTITGGSFILGGCTSTTTVTINGATVGTNTATASPIYASAPVGNQGLFNLTAWVSAPNTVTVQGCALGTLSSVPNFQAKVLLY